MKRHLYYGSRASSTFLDFARNRLASLSFTVFVALMGYEQLWMSRGNYAPCSEPQMNPRNSLGGHLTSCLHRCLAELTIVRQIFLRKAIAVILFMHRFGCIKSSGLQVCPFSLINTYNVMSKHHVNFLRIRLVSCARDSIVSSSSIRLVEISSGSDTITITDTTFMSQSR